MKGPNPNRLDLAIQNLLQYIKEKLDDRLINLYRRKVPYKVAEIRRRHKKSLESEFIGLEEDANP